ncbi:MAG: DUF1501 domain-containing protein [Armatimonadetes bacterium]|nr:DUF1501 domain-containing protein [Armatimonadota bacterium]
MEGISRREALRRALLGTAGAALAGRVLAAGPSPARPKPATAAPSARAKSVVQIWMWGGPCHIDTFDPKPEAGYDFCGALAKAIPTNVDGVQIGELLPLLAQQADKYSIVRSMTHGINAHETASYMVQTGREPGRYVYPGAGAVVSLFKGYDHGYEGMIPPYVVLTELQGRFSEAGFLGQRYKPFATGGDPGQQRFAVEGVVAQGITDERQQSRRTLLHSLDTLGTAMPDNACFAELDRCEESAYDLILGDARKLFDLNTEPAETREAYGRNTFGQSCLMARRLVEAGMPYVTINYKGWDTHKQHFETMRRRLPEMDKGLATLLQDLAARGLLDTTIVWWSGEFGRSPRVSWEAPWNGGRQHWGQCFSAVLAGGGFRGGQVVGASNATGEEVAERPVYPLDVIGSIYELLGIDPQGPLPNPLGLDTTVLPTATEGVKAGGRLKEIMS